MQVQKYNGYQSPNFGTAIPITTNDNKIAIQLMRLGKLLHQQANPQFRYLPLTRSKEGSAFRGIFGDGDHKEVIESIQLLPYSNRLRPRMVDCFERTVSEESNQPQNITNLLDILNLPIFANCREEIVKTIRQLV